MNRPPCQRPDALVAVTVEFTSHTGPQTGQYYVRADKLNTGKLLQLFDKDGRSITEGTRRHGRFDSQYVFVHPSHILTSLAAPQPPAAPGPDAG